MLKYIYVYNYLLIFYYFICRTNGWWIVLEINWTNGKNFDLNAKGKSINVIRIGDGLVRYEIIEQLLLFITLKIYKNY